MKKTLKFDDGSVLVGSSSTFTVTQEDQGKLDIFDMPSKYIWISTRGILDGYDDREGNTYYGIQMDSGAKHYTLTVQDLQPFKYDNIKCKVIERTDTEDAVLKLTNTDGSTEYSFYPNMTYNSKVQKVEALQELDQVNINYCSSLTTIILMGNITQKITVNGCPKLTNITCDRPILPRLISITNNLELLSVPEFESAIYCNMKAAFKNNPKLDMNTEAFNLVGDCSEMFMNTGITVLHIYDDGITNLKSFADNVNTRETLQEVHINGTLKTCTDFSRAFAVNTALKKCNMSRVDFGNATSVNEMFYACGQLTTVGMNFATMGDKMSNIGAMFGSSGITDDIILPTSMPKLNKAIYLCSPYTKKLVLPNSETLMFIDQNYRIMLDNATSLEYLEWPNFTNNENNTSIKFTSNTKLGTGSEENLQAFKNLFTNAFDRKTAGYTVCTVSLAATQKALLTAEEITAFENKGYKIA